MAFRRFAPVTKGRGILIAVVLATLPALFGFTWDQGFETDTSGWFPIDSSVPTQAVVNRVLQPSPSSSYNSGTTSVYANGLNAASGSYLGRVASQVKDPPCSVDLTGAIGPSLLCYGPYTSFGLTPKGHAHAPFPTGGYTISIDIYLDSTYSSHHSDCSTVPCVPDQPGVLNYDACIGTNPTTACESSRFNWTVGINKPTQSDPTDPYSDYLHDFVFSVGTAPAPSVFGNPWTAGTNCPSGYIISTGYNSYRSGVNPYLDSVGNTLCLPAGGWYTFRQVYSQTAATPAGLHVDWSIRNPGGTVAQCQNPSGNMVDCAWSQDTGDLISNVGCPRYGWLADEEINDLAIDNTHFASTGGDCNQVQATAQITPTSTTCQQYAAGTAATLGELTYSTAKNGTIGSVAPGVFFYYTTFTVGAAGTVDISQAAATPTGPIPILNGQAILYSSSCAKIANLTVTDGTASGTLPAAGTYIVGAKYSPSALKGQQQPNASTNTYTFDTSLNGSEAVTATLPLIKR